MCGVMMTRTDGGGGGLETWIGEKLGKEETLLDQARNVRKPREN